MTARRFCYVLFALYAAVVALQFSGLLHLQPHDDAWFFKRFARNLLEHGVMAWNPEDGPVHGNTSQLYQLVALAVTFAAEDHYIFGIRVVLAASVAGAMAAMLRLAERCGGAGYAAPALAFCSPVVLYTIPSGMETALSLFALAGFVLLLRRGSPRSAVGCLAVPGAMVGIYLLRPDAALLAGIAWAWDRLVIRRAVPWREGAAFAAMMVGALALLAAYFGSPLPLSFYLKSGQFSVYSEYFVEVSREGKLRNMALFAAVVAPLVYLALQRLSRENAGLLLAGAAFVLYHYVSTVEVMGMYARFYAPALPVFAAAALPGVAALRSRRRAPLHLAFLLAYTAAVAGLYRAGALPDDTLWIIMRVSPELYVGYTASTWLVFLAALGLPRASAIAIVLTSAVSVWAAHPERSVAVFSDEDYKEAQLAHRSGFREIGALPRCLGDEIAVYHSEIGLPGEMLPEGHVTDLAGLMTEEFALGEKTFDEYCLADPPEAIYLPHPNYDWLRAEIETSECLESFVEVRGHDTSSPLYIRDDLAGAYRACR